jgi:hypothetical protein
MLLPKLGGLWLFPPWDFPHQNESHPMDHDSNSSGHTNIQAPHKKVSGNYRVTRRMDPVLFILLMTLAMISQLRKRGKRRFPRKKESMADLR